MPTTLREPALQPIQKYTRARAQRAEALAAVLAHVGLVHQYDTERGSRYTRLPQQC
jgi:hypothetical protein